MDTSAAVVATKLTIGLGMVSMVGRAVGLMVNQIVATVIAVHALRI